VTQVLFLLKDDQGRPLAIADANTKDEADRFGRNHLAGFSGDSIEIEMSRPADAEPTEEPDVRVVRVAVDGSNRTGMRTSTSSVVGMTQILVLGPELPEEVEEAGLLTPEDHRDLTLDHIARTSALVAQIEIIKWA
jgi:hypothetical protein